MNLELKFLEAVKEATHVMLHRMTLWQYITRGRWWRKQYNDACEKIAQKLKEIENE